MNIRLIITSIGALVAAYLAGRFFAPEKIKIETVTVTKEVVVQDESAKLRQTQRIIETTRPDGTTVKETRIKTRAESERKTTETRDEASKKVKEIENRRGVVMGPLVGLHTGTAGIMYGFHVNAPIAGPIHMGGDVIVSPMFGLAALVFVGLSL